MSLILAFAINDRRLAQAAAIKPWTTTSWKTPRDPGFAQKAAPVLDLYNGTWEGEGLSDRDVIICADKKTVFLARSRQR